MQRGHEITFFSVEIWMSDTHQPWWRPGARWPSAPSPPGCEACLRGRRPCSWQWGRWRGSPSERWQRPSTAGRTGPRCRPAPRSASGPDGSQNPSPASAPSYSLSGCRRVEGGGDTDIKQQGLDESTRYKVEFVDVLITDGCVAKCEFVLNFDLFTDCAWMLF